MARCATAAFQTGAELWVNLQAQHALWVVS